MIAEPGPVYQGFPFWHFQPHRRTLVRSMSGEIKNSVQISHREVAPGAVAISIGGRLMMGPESECIPNMVEALLQQGSRKFVFDLVGVTSIDSTGIGRFIYSFNRISAVGGEMRMAGATGHVFEAFHVSLLDTVFQFYPTVDEALTDWKT